MRIDKKVAQKMSKSGPDMALFSCWIPKKIFKEKSESVVSSKEIDKRTRFGILQIHFI